MHPDFSRWIAGDLTDDEYAASLAARVDAVTTDRPHTGEDDECGCEDCR